MTTFAFLERGCYRVEAGCFPRNVASSRVMEKSGLRYEGVLHAYLRKGDRFEDAAVLRRTVQGGTDMLIDLVRELNHGPLPSALLAGVDRVGLRCPWPRH